MRKIILALSLVLLLISPVQALDLFQPSVKNMAVSDFTLQDLSGNSVTLSEFKGQGIILFFWTTWCPHCRKQLSNFNNEYASMNSSGIKLLAIDIGEPKRRVESFTGSYSLKYPVLLDMDGNVASKYGVQGVPTIILISKQGNIVSVTHALSDDYKQLILE